MRGVLLWLFDSAPVQAIVKSFLFRPLVTRFIAGSTPEEALEVAVEMAGQGFLISLDFLGENVATEQAANDCLNSYIDLITRVAATDHRERMTLSIKLTQLGLDIGDELAFENYCRLLEEGAMHKVFIRVDMEGSDYTQRTIDLVSRAHQSYPLTGTVLQSMLRSTESDIERFISEGIPVRLVKGAYLEPEQIAFQEKSKVDEMFVSGAERLLDSAERAAIATHDESIIATLREYAESNQIEKDRFEWQMLYGIRRDLQERLLNDGYNVRIYVPFGSSWYPYFTRRLLERPANIMFIAKALIHR